MIIRRGPGLLAAAVLGAASVAAPLSSVVATAAPAAAAVQPIRVDVWMTLDHSVVTWEDLTFELTLRWGNKGLEDASYVTASVGGGPTPAYTIPPASAPSGWSTNAGGINWTGSLKAGEVREAKIRVATVHEYLTAAVTPFGGRIDGGVQRPEDSLDDAFQVDVNSCDLVTLYYFPAALRPACATHTVTYLPPPVQHNVPSEVLHLPAAGQPIPPSTRPIPAPGTTSAGSTGSTGSTARTPSPRAPATTRPASVAKSAAAPPAASRTAAVPGAPSAAAATEAATAATRSVARTTAAQEAAVTPTASPPVQPAPSREPQTRALGPLEPVAAWTTSSPWVFLALLALLVVGPLGLFAVRRRARS